MHEPIVEVSQDLSLTNGHTPEQHYLRKRLSAEDLRALHTQVLDEMVETSKKRMATTGTGLQQTGATAKAVSDAHTVPTE